MGRRVSEERLPLDLLVPRAGSLREAIALRPADWPLLVAAGALDEPALRALDAIHVASAIDLHPVDTFVTYDERQAAAARLAGLRTIAPGTRV
jgi:predicted nucleic acid-binding protein